MAQSYSGSNDADGGLVSSRLIWVKTDSLLSVLHAIFEAI